MADNKALNRAEIIAAQWLKQPAPEGGRTMYEELIKSLRCHQSKEGKPCLSCSCEQQFFCDTRHDTEAAYALEDLINQLAALQAENGSKGKEIERLEKCRHECKIDCLLEEYNRVCEKLSRVEAERDAAVKEIPHVCMTCRHGGDDTYCDGCCCDGDQWNATEDKWEWNGAQGEA